MTQFEIDVEGIVGQFCFAFGAGAGPLRIQRQTIETLQARYRPYLLANLETESGRRAWSDAKFHLLEYVTAMGRYAASLALQAGEMTILPEHFEVAAKRFEHAAHRTRTRAIKAGPWCPGSRSTDGPRPVQPETQLERGPRPAIEFPVQGVPEHVR
jgi:hypothetical protein